MDGTAEQLLTIVAATVVVYGAILYYTRLTGLRSFSKMSASDFAMTVAVGSLFASTAVSPEQQFGPGLVALATLFASQFAIAWARRKSSWFSRIVDNEPLLLMRNGRVLDENLNQAQVTRADLIAKLREANVWDLNQVAAVVFETTGDISVLHGNHSSDVSPQLLEDVSPGELGRSQA
ncbi:DUF421 domain-containing protein [Bremerella cremea]|uniref:DUF421 domain-containing protein n=1 Tax=Blastopirellula marina TaxID=124 RepID=A0A2S8G0T8_9BACT|nr:MULTISPECIES: YetF domain-containing protein [Pirellulaceae]PQO37754.1 DUF421 domain-containing protein [Blastopirellula marina]RCS50141.1 DUF421 domain-containing protein [Bremerella cremea]